jgi:hypothetical protein
LAGTSSWLEPLSLLHLMNTYSGSINMDASAGPIAAKPCHRRRSDVVDWGFLLRVNEIRDKI